MGRQINAFCGVLIQNGKKSTTAKSYISVIKAVLADVDVKLSENRVLLNSLTRACKLKYDTVHTRLPIKKNLLQAMIRKTIKIYNNQPYLTILYRAMILTAYFGLFRIGEISASDHVVKAKDVHVGTNEDKLLFLLRSLKTHNKANKPQLIKISSESMQCTKQGQRKWLTGSVQNFKEAVVDLYCPFRAVRDYIKVRRKQISDDEQFFIFRDRSPVKLYHFRAYLKKVLKSMGIDQTLYDTHSLRAGRSVDLLKLGLSVETIKKIGRWKSNAVYTYLN